MGSDKKNANRGLQFAQMIRNTMEEPAWRALSVTAQALYPWLKLEWHGPKHNKNGRIFLSVRQAAERLGVSNNTAAAAFHDLQAKGFIVAKRSAHLGVKGQAKATLYEITELAMPQDTGSAGRKLYRQWRPGHDFPVQKATIHNPKGSRKVKNLSQELRRDV